MLLNTSSDMSIPNRRMADGISTVQGTKQATTNCDGVMGKQDDKNTIERGEGPMVVHQRTLKRPVSCSGPGLHSGETVSLTLHPGEPNSRIIFKRTDIEEGDCLIPASWDRVVDTRLCTVLGNADGVTVGTVEHLMAALAGCGIDNVMVEIDGPEVPIMDGSSAPFVFLVECAGVVEQKEARRVIRILKPITVEDGDATASLKPADRLSFDVEIEFNGTLVSHQSLNIGLVNGTFCKELAQARTFGFLHEVEALQAAGLAKGGSLDNAIVVSGDKVLNEGGLRYDDEFVRHKMLDAVGDLYLAGVSIMGAFEGVRCGHKLNNALLRDLFADDEAWCYDTISGDEAGAAVDGGIWAQPAVA